MGETTTTLKQPPQRIPEELVSSALFLLKRLGMAAKEQSFEAYEAAGLHPYHHAILAVLDEGSRETQGAIADVRLPGDDPFDRQLQLSQLRYTVSSRAAATSLAENYTGTLAAISRLAP